MIKQSLCRSGFHTVQMVTTFGMPEIGPWLSDRAYEIALTHIRNNREAIDKIVEILLEKETITEISAELQRERQKNAELIERISILEAQILKRDNNSLLSNGQVSILAIVNYY
ncbi:hypothetical protein LOK49_LG02G00919 [Camellia lanceoleosa]|uniref:Uncharacterized protein n=1 Tax=Camellia lanceoleosa TaxID=1840588 RepID=A0ACC0IKN7_9ERIC|nr:hypothetical protein LOK49_LG02G00919 [Camellia lanceoleosa]